METLLLATAARTDSNAGDPTTDTTAWAVDVLDDLMGRVGVDGLVAAYSSKALKSVVDEHAAAITEQLAAKGLGVELRSLAGYASAVLVAAQSRGRLLPADPSTVNWLTADWYVLRLLAVCAMAVELES